MASRPMIIQPPPPRGYNPTFPGTPAAAIPTATPRAYNPSSPRRVRPDADRNAFDAMAQQAGAMSDAYNGMAQSGVIPNELRGYIDRDKMVAQRNEIAKELNWKTGGNPYVANLGSPVVTRPGGLSYNPIERMAATGRQSQYAGGGSAKDVMVDAGDIKTDTVLGFSAQPSDVQRYRTFNRIRDVGRVPTAEEVRSTPGMSPQDLGFQQYRDYTNKYGAQDRAEWSRKYGMNADSIRRFKNGDYQRENYGTNAPTSLEQGIDKGVKPTSDTTNFELDAKEIFGELPGGVARNYPQLPPGKTTNDLDVGLEAERRLGRPGWATKYMNEMRQMRKNEEQGRVDLLRKHMGDAENGFSGMDDSTAKEVVDYLATGQSNKMTQHGIGISIWVQNLRNTIAKLPPEKRRIAAEYFRRMAKMKEKGASAGDVPGTFDELAGLNDVDSGLQG